jgi:hypothetical protein
VCCEVLNLPSQVGFLLGCSALARAYRVTLARLDPILWVLAQNRVAATIDHPSSGSLSGSLVRVPSLEVVSPIPSACTLTTSLDPRSTPNASLG